MYVDYFYHGLDEAYPTPSMNVSTTRTLLNGNVQNKIVQVCEELPTLESDGGVVAKVDSLEGPQPSVIPPTLEERLAEPLVDIGSLTMREVFIAGIADQAKQWAQLVSADAPKLPK